jgi:hypothetical protein
MGIATAVFEIRLARATAIPLEQERRAVPASCTSSRSCSTRSNLRTFRPSAACLKA